MSRMKQIMKLFGNKIVLAVVVCSFALLALGAVTDNGQKAAPIRFAEIRQMDGKVVVVVIDHVSEPRTGMLRIVTADGLTFETSPLNVLLRSHL